MFYKLKIYWLIAANIRVVVETFAVKIENKISWIIDSKN